MCICVCTSGRNDTYTDPHTLIGKEEGAKSHLVVRH